MLSEDMWEIVQQFSLCRCCFSDRPSVLVYVHVITIKSAWATDSQYDLATTVRYNNSDSWLWCRHHTFCSILQSHWWVTYAPCLQSQLCMFVAQLCHSPGYKVFKGQVLNSTNLSELIEGLRSNSLLHYSHVLTGNMHVIFSSYPDDQSYTLFFFQVEVCVVLLAVT